MDINSCSLDIKIHEEEILSNQLDLKERYKKTMTMEIKAPMPGKIASIIVDVGSLVKEEDEVIIMDAMKMEIPVYAPAAGVIKKIEVKVGDTVNEGQVLVVLE
jgi:acetyl-CoA carboxylase biotin carboxyl carrier protein